MKRHKFNIQNNVLSWEKNHIKKCDRIECTEKGEFKAPKSRIKLNEYYFFCMKHIKEYNKSWDFYKGLTVNEIEYSMREDTIWNRPSWPLKGNPYKVIEQIDYFFNDIDKELNQNKVDDTFFRNKVIDQTLTKEENTALSTLKLNLPLNMDKLKKNYKKLVKIFHPDVNGSDNQAEEKFKKVNESYKLLLKKLAK